MSKNRFTLLLILFAPLLFFSQRTYCQTVSKQNKPVLFSLYGEGGFAHSSFHSSNESLNPEFSPVSSFAIGAGANMRFWQKTSRNRFVEDGLFAVQAGLLYTQSGFKAEEVKISGNYLCIPMAFQFYPISDLYVEMDMEACMNVGLSPSSAAIKGLKLDLDKHKANDFKIGLGAGYMHRFGKSGKVGPIGLSVKYLFGTSDFADNLPWKGNQLRISVFYRFGL